MSVLDRHMTPPDRIYLYMNINKDWAITINPIKGDVEYRLATQGTVDHAAELARVTEQRDEALACLRELVKLDGDCRDGPSNDMGLRNFTLKMIVLDARRIVEGAK